MLNVVTVMILISGGWLYLALQRERLTDDLNRAIENGNLAGVVAALDAGADPNETNGGRTMSTWEYLKDICRRMVGDREPKGQPALVLAVNHWVRKQPDADPTVILRTLLDRGADVNIQDTVGHTALMWSAMGGETGAAQLFLSRSASPNVRDHQGHTALSWAVLFGQTVIIRALLDQGADVNASDHDGYTPLMWAAMRGDVTCARLLFDKGAALNKQDNEGCTALMLAASSGEVGSVQFLLDRGADEGTLDKESETALKLAQKCGYPKVAHLLQATTPDREKSSPMINARTR
jgi:ankyrin repeat protein